MMIRPGLVSSIGLAIVVALGACAATPVKVDSFYAEVPRSSITSITLRHTACDGTCPISTLRLMADGRATFEGDGRTMFDGDLFAARKGRFRASVDFEELAAWVDSQHPETLADRYGANVDGAPGVELRIARGKDVKSISAVLSLAPVRFIGIVFALEGASQRLNWRRDDPYTALLANFTNGSSTLSIEEQPNRVIVYSRPVLCPPNGPEAVREGDAIRIRCNGATSTVRATADGLRAEGSAIAAGAYRGISSRELARLNGESGVPIVP